MNLVIIIFMSNKSIKSSSTLESKCFSDSSSLKSVKSIKSKAKERVIKKFTYEHLNLLENLFIEDPQWSRATIRKKFIHYATLITFRLYIKLTQICLTCFKNKSLTL